MSTLPSAEPQSAATPVPHSVRGAAASFAVCLPSMPAEDLHGLIERLRHLFPGEPLLIATPDQAEDQTLDDGSVLSPYPVPRTEGEWVLSAEDYAAAARVAEQHGVNGVLLFGGEAASLQPEAIIGLRQVLHGQIDLVVPRYRTGPTESLVNSALLYPLTRALFAVDVRFPLPLDAALSLRMAQRIAGVAARRANTDDGLVWPVAEAAVAGYSVRQADAGTRALPRPQQADFNDLFQSVTASLFTDVENKATFWQRARTLPASRAFSPAAPSLPIEHAEEIRSLVEGFRLAFSNLREIWSLVLPPQSLLALKKLSVLAPESFSFPPSLWARVVYDFALAFHLRTLNRGHLLGALTPLYLAWVASLLRDDGSPALLEATASAFEQEKPYLVSRWRWPDRFNP